MKSNDPDTSWQVKDFNDVLQKEVDQNLNRLYDGVFHKVGRSSKFPLHPLTFSDFDVSPGNITSLK